MQPNAEPTDGTRVRPPLVRSRDDRLLTGVCAGIALHLGVPVLWVRAGVVLASLLGGAGAILYVFLLFTMPEHGESDEVAPMRRLVMQAREAVGLENNQGESHEPAHSASPASKAPQSAHRERSRGTHRPWPVAEMLFGACFLIAGIALVVTQFGVELRLEVILPGLAVLVGVGLTWWLITGRERPDQHLLPRVLGALALVAVGVLMFFVTAREPSVFTVVGAALAVLAGVALAITPWLLRLNRELVAERAARARETERSEIAAHLHDSVLQTLALIQQRSQPGDEVARLARAQERELREWLFRVADGAPPEALDTAEAELREHATLLEAAHAVRFEVVAVGDRIVAPAAIVAAAKEAMLNAARHAGGDVTVFLETTADSVRIDVSDRGPGFALDSIEGARLGVRESILGRMERVGGSATIVPGPGGRGVSVRLQQHREALERAENVEQNIEGATP